MNISELNNLYLNLWFESSSSDFPLTKVYSEKDKSDREIILKNQLPDKTSFRKHSSKEKMQKNLFNSAKNSAKILLDVNETYLDIIFSEEFKQASKDFISAAREFDPDITMDDISQAARNVWVMNCFQYLLGIPVRLTPSIFAYSLLYPYCDNYLDDFNITDREKHQFNIKLGERLEGMAKVPANINEQKIFALIGMIEREYDRELYANVYKSLSSIHKAQCKSIKLHKDKNLSELSTLEISFEKGGTSVLADGYLINGELTAMQKKILYGFGIYLQIIDDLQDIKEDSNSGISTIFTNHNHKKELDDLTNRSFNFGSMIINYIECISPPQKSASFKQLMQKSTSLLMIESACLAETHYSKSYIKNLENYSPLSFSFIRNYRNKLHNQKKFSFNELIKII